ncbi:hypothetical protein BO71DRAFT_434626 [Aspergillus ellipticus CBS 707.79]|uniref:F-box domain-containing protein n=1 Tax=Aspergillus ellipticus CBS 707.79 TaxID=1448320 RepID=A0A319D561_9EURO|nr:hypothetical protein BO71DRAFT_434626 [Aspergillus ellipticus CBS 707.79]
MICEITNIAVQLFKPLDIWRHNVPSQLYLNLIDSSRNYSGGFGDRLSTWISLEAPPDQLSEQFKIRVINDFLLHNPGFEAPDYKICDSLSSGVGIGYAPWSWGHLNLDLPLPTGMNELQERFFIDLVSIWRYYIDDDKFWTFTTSFPRAFGNALLRLAAWDFEISFDEPSDFVTTVASLPSWGYPGDDIYWFHGFLIIFQSDIEMSSTKSRAFSRAKVFLRDERLGNRVYRFILMSLRHVAFAELDSNGVLLSDHFDLLSNLSGYKCSPGFRVLTRVLTCLDWRETASQLEWERSPFKSLPLEVLTRVFEHLRPRDAVAFAQACPAGDICYYSHIAQLNFFHRHLLAIHPLL